MRKTHWTCVLHEWICVYLSFNIAQFRQFVCLVCLSVGVVVARIRLYEHTHKQYNRINSNVSMYDYVSIECMIWYSNSIFICTQLLLCAIIFFSAVCSISHFSAHTFLVFLFIAFHCLVRSVVHSHTFHTLRPHSVHFLSFSTKFLMQNTHFIKFNF